MARKLGIYDRVGAITRHLPEIIVAMEHGDKARADNYVSIILSHLFEIQESCDDIMTLTMNELGRG